MTYVKGSEDNTSVWLIAPSLPCKHMLAHSGCFRLESVVTRKWRALINVESRDTHILHSVTPRPDSIYASGAAQSFLGHLASR
jgi:hypothetical protein